MSRPYTVLFTSGEASLSLSLLALDDVMLMLLTWMADIFCLIYDFIASKWLPPVPPKQLTEQKPKDHASPQAPKEHRSRHDATPLTNIIKTKHCQPPK